MRKIFVSFLLNRFDSNDTKSYKLVKLIIRHGSLIKVQQT